MRANTLRSLVASWQAGAAPGAHAVVLHPGSAKAGDVGSAVTRAGEVIAEALAQTDGCPLHLENTAGSGGTPGRSFGELAALIEAAGGDERLGPVPGLLPPAGRRAPDPYGGGPACRA